MTEKNFLGTLQQSWNNGRLLCVGLDTDPTKIPKHIDYPRLADRIYEFNMQIVEATKDLVCAFKPNRGFYKAQGNEGDIALLHTIVGIHSTAPGVEVIVDQKTDDIGKTNAQYVADCFDRMSADAITVHPTFGQEGLQPFLNQKNKGIVVLCKTSNAGSGEFQDKLLAISKEEFSELEHYLTPDAIHAFGWEITHGYVLIPLYQYIALRVGYFWNANQNCALVVGATYPEQLAWVRKLVPTMPLLIPGIGSQGGDLEATVKAGQDKDGHGMIINVSSSLIYASDGRDFAQAARREALKLSERINQYRISHI